MIMLAFRMYIFIVIYWSSLVLATTLDKLNFQKCGELCQWDKGNFTDGPYFDHRTVSDVSCPNLFSKIMFPVTGHGLKHAPKNIPSDLWDDFTNHGKIPIKLWYFDQIYLNQQALVSEWSRRMIDDMINKARNGILRGSYGISETNHLRQALKHAPGV